MRPVCPTHHIPDCSPLLNGCSLPEALVQAYRQGVQNTLNTFDQMWQEEDWEGQCSIGFASTFSQEVYRLLEGP